MDVLSIHTERAQLEIHSEPAQVTITNSRPTFVIRRTRPQMQIVRQMPHFNIEWEEMPGLSASAAEVQLSRRFDSGASSKDGETKSTESLKATLEGKALGQIVKNNNDLGRPNENSKKVSHHKRANISWERGSFDVRWIMPELEIEWEMGDGPIIEVEPHSVEITLRNRPSVTVNVNMENLRAVPGLRVDKHI